MPSLHVGQKLCHASCHFMNLTASLTADQLWAWIFARLATMQCLKIKSEHTSLAGWLRPRPS